MTAFDNFIKQKKFYEDYRIAYPGIADSSLRSVYTEKINRAAEDFREVAMSPNPTKQAYLDKIKTGLARFNDTYVKYDTEDAERVCHYFEELMQIVGVDSSDGILNNYLYGFDPDKIKK